MEYFREEGLIWADIPDRLPPITSEEHGGGGSPGGPECAADEESERTRRARSRYKLPKPTVSNLLTPARLHPHRVPQPSKHWSMLATEFSKLKPVRDVAEFKPQLLVLKQTTGNS